MVGKVQIAYVAFQTRDKRVTSKREMEAYARSGADGEVCRGNGTEVMEEGDEVQKGGPQQFSNRLECEAWRSAEG